MNFCKFILFSLFVFNMGFSTIYIESPMDLSEDTNPEDYESLPVSEAQVEQEMPTQQYKAHTFEEQTPEGTETEFGVTPQW